MHLAPHAGLSISLDGCMENGKDCVCGGAKYNSYGGTATGLATIADSLTTIKYMVFDKKLCTAKTLYDAVMANWQGYEVLRHQILTRVPHFGNDDPYADEQMKWICDVYYEICSECYSTRIQSLQGWSLRRSRSYRLRAILPGPPLTAEKPASLWLTLPLRLREGTLTVLPQCSTRLAALTTATTWMGLH